MSKEELKTEESEPENKEPEITKEELEQKLREENERKLKWKRLEIIHRHIRLVQDNCFKLAKNLHAMGEEEFARKLIANALVHDNSKFHGIEWLHLHDSEEGSKPTDIGYVDPENKRMAHLQHVSTNDHHPEFHGGDTLQMSRLQVAEMLCDWKARSDEFGTSLVDWMKTEGYPRFGIPKQGKIAKQMNYFLSLLLDKPFGGIK